MKRKWVILVCVVTALAGSATIYTLRQTPIYQATTKLEIDQQSDNVLPYQIINQHPNSGYYDYQEFLQTQINHITSRSLAAVLQWPPASIGNSLRSLSQNCVWLRSGPRSPASKKPAEEDRPPTREESFSRRSAWSREVLQVTPGTQFPHRRRSATTLRTRTLAARIVNILAR